MDFRSDKSESPEGKGVARNRWERYLAREDSRLLTAWDTLAMAQPGWFESQVGFWVTWHLYGGFEGLEARGMSRATIWRKVAKFRRTWHKHPDEFVVPGVTLDPEWYWNTLAEIHAAKRKNAKTKTPRLKDTA